MENKNFNGNNGLATQHYEFKYMETTWIDGRQMSFPNLPAY